VRSEGITGGITGRAIYEGTLDFKAAQSLADELIGADELTGAAR
jgi:phosphoribosylformimino-5-aminoimidazole carboxamide ribotide isomerase